MKSSPANSPAGTQPASELALPQQRPQQARHRREHACSAQPEGERKASQMQETCRHDGHLDGKINMTRRVHQVDVVPAPLYTL
jgi:hypothetical protein